jgi:hypothetical protein
MANIDLEKNKQFDGITVDDGSEEVIIHNKQHEEIGRFYFRPTDLGIIDRFNKVAADIPGIIEPLENVNIKPDGTADENSDEEFAALKEAETRLYEAVDYLFGGNLSEAFFGKMHPFSPVKGKNGETVFYCENALDSLGAFISKRFDRGVKAIEKRVSRYTHGYTARTGKHRKAKN